MHQSPFQEFEFFKTGRKVENCEEAGAYQTTSQPAVSLDKVGSPLPACGDGPRCRVGGGDDVHGAQANEVIE